jgi:hypothetical protein
VLAFVGVGFGFDEKEAGSEVEEEMGGKSRSTYLTSSGFRSSIFVTPRSCIPVSISPLITIAPSVS